MINQVNEIDPQVKMSTFDVFHIEAMVCKYFNEPRFSSDTYTSGTQALNKFDVIIMAMRARGSMGGGGGEQESEVKGPPSPPIVTISFAEELNGGCRY
jgi:hypothetical protein